MDIAENYLKEHHPGKFIIFRDWCVHVCTVEFKEKELDVSVSYEIIKKLEASLIYVNVDNDQKDESYDAYKAHISYNF